MADDEMPHLRDFEALVYAFAHDLRNPLGAILTGAHMLGRMEPDERVPRTAARIAASAGRIAKMTEQLVDLTRLQLGAGIELYRTSVDLPALVNKVVEDVREPPNDVAIEVEVRGGQTQGEWDEERLEQLLSNLLHNSAKHRAPASTVHVAIEADGENATLTVVNEGTIPEDRLRTLFDPYRRLAGGRDVGTDGLGVGLYVSREIARAHGGELSVSTGPDTTTVRVLLPVGAPRA